MKQVCVVGASGVLGRALIPLLVAQGYRVKALARSQPSEGFPVGVTFVRYDLLDEQMDQVLHSALYGCDAALHLATAIPRDMTVPNAFAMTNRLRTEGTNRLLAASLAAGVHLYVQQSIVMAYVDGGDNWLDEDTPLGTTYTAVTTMESLVRSVPPDQMNWCILRGGAFVGKDTAQDVMLERLKTGKETVACNGSNFISPIHVADMASAILAVLQRDPHSAILNIADEPLRQGDYVDRLASLIGVPTPKHDDTLACPPSWRCSNQRARQLLGWQPTHSIWPDVPIP